jgi:hypothetical protein
MLENNQKKEFRQYCLQFYKDLRHPFGGQESSINFSDLETSLDIFEGVLSLEVAEESLQGIEEQFYSAFNNYLILSRTEIGNLCNNINTLSRLIDPFLKKIALLFFTDKKITKNKKQILLWKTSNYADILDAIGIIKAKKLYEKRENYWKQEQASFAILRKGFTSRQKGVHESRIYGLEHLEYLTYSIIGSFIVICLHLLKYPSIIEKVREITKKRRVIYLFKERAMSYPISNNLLSMKECLLVYRYRTEIKPDIEEKKFIFLNYLAGRGPCFYWLKDDKNLIFEWAKEFLEKNQDETIKRNSLRLLAENFTSLPFPLQLFLENFGYYEDKLELSQYIEKFAKNSDKCLLLKLYNDKREEVAMTSRALLIKMFPRIDDNLRKLSVSDSPSKRRLFRDIIDNFAKKKDLSKYRDFPNLKDESRRIIYIYCLGEVGSKQDLDFLLSWIKTGRKGKKIKMACWYAISKIANRLSDSQFVWKLINRREREITAIVLEAITRNGIGAHFKFLFTNNFARKFLLGNIILKIADKNDKKIIKNYLLKTKLNDELGYSMRYNVRDLMLALCSIGNSDDFNFLFNLFSNCNYEVYIPNHVRLAYSMAKICSREKIGFFKRAINSREFWRYIFPDKKRTTNPLPLKEVRNQALIRRLIAVSFLKISNKREIPFISKLLFHNYKWIANEAAIKLAEVGGIKEIDGLVEKLQEFDEEKLNESKPAINALCLLDKKIYSQSFT